MKKLRLSSEKYFVFDVKYYLKQSYLLQTAIYNQAQT